MKVTIEPQEKSKDVKYPCLMDGGNNIFFMTDGDTGIILQSSNGHKIGTIIRDLKKSILEPYKGKITLEND